MVGQGRILKLIKTKLGIILLCACTIVCRAAEKQGCQDSPSSLVNKAKENFQPSAEYDKSGKLIKTVEISDEGRDIVEKHFRYNKFDEIEHIEIKRISSISGGKVEREVKKPAGYRQGNAIFGSPVIFCYPDVYYDITWDNEYNLALEV